MRLRIKEIADAAGLTLGELGHKVWPNLKSKQVACNKMSSLNKSKKTSVYVDDIINICKYTETDPNTLFGYEEK